MSARSRNEWNREREWYFIGGSREKYLEHVNCRCSEISRRPSVELNSFHRADISPRAFQPPPLRPARENFDRENRIERNFSLALGKFSALQPLLPAVEREPSRGGSFLITPRDKNEFSFASIRPGNLIISPGKTSPATEREERGGKERGER